MPDVWEKAHGLSPNDPADGQADRDGDGYSNWKNTSTAFVHSRFILVWVS
jgi:hypothetical protein